MYQSFIESLQYVENTYVSYHPEWKKIGEGRSASVFKIPGTSKVIKVFFPGKEAMAHSEIQAYKKVNGAGPYFPVMHDYGNDYIVLDFIPGKTLYQFLEEGIYIEEWMIGQVDEALALARLRGLNPSDVHLKNIIVTDKGIRLIDLARFDQLGICNRWNDLKKAYYTFYLNPLFPKKIKASLLEQIAALYKENKISI